jgi:hypothetical protein
MGITTGSRDRSLMKKQVLTTTELEDVSIPVAEPRRGLGGRQVAGLFQPDE